MRRNKTRPFVIQILLILFVIGTAASLIAVISLTFPGSFLEPVWKLNPHAREGFAGMGGWAVLLMLAVCVACLFTTIGLWRGLRWGYWLAILMLIGNLAGDVIKSIYGTERRAIIGIPIVLFLLFLVMRRRTREYFEFR